jgi:hypothetical protein
MGINLECGRYRRISVIYGRSRSEGAVWRVGRYFLELKKNLAAKMTTNSAIAARINCVIVMEPRYCDRGGAASQKRDPVQEVCTNVSARIRQTPSSFRHFAK